MSKKKSPVGKYYILAKYFYTSNTFNRPKDGQFFPSSAYEDKDCLWDTKEEAEEVVQQEYNKTYYLAYGEMSSPNLTVRKVRENQKTRIYFSPTDES